MDHSLKSLYLLSFLSIKQLSIQYLAFSLYKGVKCISLVHLPRTNTLLFPRHSRNASISVFSLLDLTTLWIFFLLNSPPLWKFNHFYGSKVGEERKENKTERFTCTTSSLHVLKFSVRNPEMLVSFSVLFYFNNWFQLFDWFNLICFL